jgi:hypothetical protein
MLEPSERGSVEPRGALSEEQRTVFRSAALWMGLAGWAEVLVGGLVGVACLLRAVGLIPWPEQPSASGRAVLPILVVASMGIGILTLIAARSFRRAAQAPDAGLAAVTEAVSDLRELYERQVWITAMLIVIAIGGAIFWR